MLRFRTPPSDEGLLVCAESDESLEFFLDNGEFTEVIDAEDFFRLLFSSRLTSLFPRLPYKKVNIIIKNL